MMERGLYALCDIDDDENVGDMDDDNSWTANAAAVRRRRGTTLVSNQTENNDAFRTAVDRLVFRYDEIKV